MISINNRQSFEQGIYKALNKYLLKKYYWNSYRLKEIVEVFGEPKARIMHGPDTCIFIVIVNNNHKKVQFTCDDVRRRLKNTINNLDCVDIKEIQLAINEIFEEHLGNKI